MKDPLVYLRHIRDSIDLLEKFTGLEERRFLEDKKTQQAVLYTLQTLAESTMQLPVELKLRFPEVDWSGIVGFRNILVHEYLGVDVQMVWGIIERNVPLLDKAVRSLIEEME